MTSRYSVLERGTDAAISAAYSAVSAMPPKRDWYPQFPATVTEVSDHCGREAPPGQGVTHAPTLHHGPAAATAPR